MLALIGSGEYLTAMDPVDRELISRLSQSLQAVCLPTTAGQESPARIAYLSKLGLRHFEGLGVQVEALPVIDQASANNPEYAAVISRMNFIYLSGGKPAYLYQTLAMIMGEKISVFQAGNLL
jgi:peptidase E